MYKVILNAVLVGCISTLQLVAQNNLGKSDDVARIGLAAYIPDQIESLPDIARNLLSDKLSQLVSQNGMAGNAMNERFIITPNISVLSKDVTTSSPSMTVLTLSASLYIGDGFEGTKFAVTNLTLKGVGETEIKAYVSAIRNINTANPELKRFLENGKNKIIEYFNSKCDFLIKNAQTLAGAEKYEEAIYQLTRVPEVCKECYNKSMDAVIPIYKKQIDKQCMSELSRAKSIWAAGQNMDAASQIGEVLATISPNAACYTDAQKFVEAVGKRIYQLDQREWSFKLKMQQDEVDIQKASIRAARDIGVAYGNHQQPVVYNIKTWW